MFLEEMVMAAAAGYSDPEGMENLWDHKRGCVSDYRDDDDPLAYCIATMIADEFEDKLTDEENKDRVIDALERMQAILAGVAEHLGTLDFSDKKIGETTDGNE